MYPGARYESRSGQGAMVIQTQQPMHRHTIAWQYSVMHPGNCMAMQQQQNCQPLRAALNYLDLSQPYTDGSSNHVATSQFLAHPMQPQVGGRDQMVEYMDYDDLDNDFGLPNNIINPYLDGADGLARKRRPKRVRLTHLQTRALIMEFTRNPHPDAASRERLSQEIPVLSPRQVQVWFQNRRAKLKQFPHEDYEPTPWPHIHPHNPSHQIKSTSNCEESDEPWMSGSPGTSIRSVDDLKQFVAQGVDSIYEPEDPEFQERIQSIISQDAYPSPLSACARIPSSGAHMSSRNHQEQHTCDKCRRR